MLKTKLTDCTGCTLCECVCPVNAIKITEGFCGYCYPEIDIHKCINCNICNKFCPAQKRYPKTQTKKIFAGYVNNKDDLLSRTSGGVTTELSILYLESGGIVYGVAYSKNFKNAKHLRVDKVEDLKKIVGTKYVQADMQNIFVQIKNDIDNGNKILFVGLPCEVAAVKSFLKNEIDNILFCELVCQGPASKKTLKEYVEFLEKINNSELTDLNVRFKKNGWKIPYLKALFSNGIIYSEMFYSTEYGEAFYLQGRESCYNCKFKGKNSQADITVGDFWGVKESDEIYNSNGVSICLCHTNRSIEILQKLNNLIVREVTYECALNKNEEIINSRKKRNKTQIFSDIYSKDGLIKALFKIKNRKEKVKYVFKFVRKRGCHVFNKIFKKKNQ